MSGTTVLVHQTITIFQLVALRRTTPRQVKAPPRRRTRRRAIIISVISLLVAAGAAIAGILLFHKPNAVPPPPAVFVAVSPNGKFIASSDDSGGRIDIWSIATKRIVATLSTPYGYRAFSYSYDGKMLVVTPQYGHITIWSTATNRVITTINNQLTDTPYCVALSPDDKILAVCPNASDDLYLFDIAHGSITATLHPVGNSPCGGGDGAAFSPDGKVLAVAALPCSGEDSVQLWDTSTRHITATTPGGFYPVVYSHDGSLLAAGGVLVWQHPGNSGSTWIIGHGGLSNPVAFSPDDKVLATPDGPTGTTFLWNLSTKHRIASFIDPNSEGVSGIAYTPDGKTLVVADSNQHIYLWNIATRHIAATLAIPTDSR